MGQTNRCNRPTQTTSEQSKIVTNFQLRGINLRFKFIYLLEGKKIKDLLKVKAEIYIPFLIYLNPKLGARINWAHIKNIS